LSVEGLRICRGIPIANLIFSFLCILLLSATMSTAPRKPPKPQDRVRTRLQFCHSLRHVPRRARLQSLSRRDWSLVNPIVNPSDVEPFHRIIDMVLGAHNETATQVRARHDENEARILFVDSLKHNAASQDRETSKRLQELTSAWA
jgi:hypothetical protein